MSFLIYFSKYFITFLICFSLLIFHFPFTCFPQILQHGISVQPVESLQVHFLDFPHQYPAFSPIKKMSIISKAINSSVAIFYFSLLKFLILSSSLNILFKVLSKKNIPIIMANTPIKIITANPIIFYFSLKLFICKSLFSFGNSKSFFSALFICSLVISKHLFSYCS